MKSRVAYPCWPRFAGVYIGSPSLLRNLSGFEVENHSICMLCGCSSLGRGKLFRALSWRLQMLFRAGYGSQVCRTAQLYPYSRFSSHKYAFLCDFEQVWAFHGIVAVWKKKSSPRSVVCLGDQECFSRYGIDCRSSYRLMCVLTMTSRFSHKHVFFLFVESIVLVLS